MRSDAKPGAEFWTSERCFITELMNRDDSPEVSIARTRVEPGVTTQLHSLSVHEWYVIESGIGRMTVGDAETKIVGCGDVVHIAKNQPQQIENHGSEDLLFLCVCVPKFSQNCYTSLE